MPQKPPSNATNYQLPTLGGGNWQPQVATVALRYNREYQQQAFDLPPEIESMPLFHDWAAGTLAAKIAAPFWQLVRPQKNQHILDLGCGLSFLIYPCWREWPVYFHGQEVSNFAHTVMNQRGPQMNSKLFKGVTLAAADQIPAPAQPYDWVIATGFSCYYPPEYWAEVVAAVKQVLKPDGQFVFDLLDPEAALAENWAILETFLGADVQLEPLADWEKQITKAGGKIATRQPGELFQLYRVGF